MKTYLSACFKIAVLLLCLMLLLVGCRNVTAEKINVASSSSQISEEISATESSENLDEVAPASEAEVVSSEDTSETSATSESKSEVEQDSPASSEQLPTEIMVDHDEDYQDLDSYLFKTLDKKDFGYLERISNKNGYQITCLKIGTVDAEKVRQTVEQYLEKNKIEGLNIEYIPARRSYHELETIAEEIKKFCDENELDMVTVFWNIETIAIQMRIDYPELHEYLENHPDKDCFVIQVITVPDPLV